MRESHVRFTKKRVSADSPIDEPMSDSAKVVDLFKDMENETKEKLVAISVDAKLKIITFEVVSIGSVSAISVRPFELLRTSVVVNASGLILVHNHPSGDPAPSTEDEQLTKSIAKLCDEGGITLHDHIVIGQDDYYSFSNEGQIKRGK